MQISALSRKLLQLIFSRSSVTTAITRPRLARGLGVSLTELNPALDELARLGLVDAQRLRLTLMGLALAVAASPAKPQRVRPERRALTVLRAPVALFSQRETPRAVA